MFTQIFFIIVVISIWVLLHGYIGWHGWQLLSPLISPGYIKIYWGIIAVLAGSFLLTRILVLPVFVSKVLIWIGSYWLGILFYAFLMCVIIDIISLANKWLGFIPPAIKISPVAGLVLVAGFFAFLLIYGTWNAMNPVIRQYQVNIPKPVNGPSQIRTIVVSDLHLGIIMNEKRLSKIVTQINERNPDIILLAGDIIDDNVGEFELQNMSSTLQLLQAPLGKFAVLGNHEYIAGKFDNAVTNLQESGVIVLRDSVVQLSNGLILVGRDERHSGRPGRASIEQIMSGIDHKRPIIMMDHQPVGLDEALANGVDLQISGHTHLGQLFPNHLITRKIYEIDYGFLQKEDLQVIVTCGVGTWGPPIRIGNRPELVELIISFTGPDNQ